MALDNNTLISGELWNPPYPVLIQAFGWLVASILSLETILGNAMVLLAYHLERPISKQLNNRFIVSLAVSDLIIGIEGIPFFTVYAINGDRWPLGAIACETWLFLDYTLCLVSILTVLLITADRYLSVCHTAQYLKWQTPMKVQILIFASWILPALIFGLMIYGWPWIGEREEQIEATSNGECYAPFLANPFVNMSMYLAYYWTTLVAMLILYKGIHKAAKKLEKRSRAREHRHIALLLTQRLGTQVGVGLMLHARKYHEEVMKTKQPSTDVKDSGYTTNNTLSTNESTERRRSSFAILVKAVQSTQKLAQFRGRGTTFAFRTDSNEGNETPRRTRQLGIQMQPAKLERLSEQNSGGQIVETQCESKEQVNVNEKEENIEQCKLNAVQSEEYFKEIDAGEEIDDADDIDFPTNTMHYRFDSGAIASLTTEAFHEESLSSLLLFNPSALTSPVLDPAYSDSSSEIAVASNNKKANGFKINQKFVKRHCFSLTSREQRNWGFINDHITTGSLKERNIKAPNFPTTGTSMPEKRTFIMHKQSSKLMAKPEDVCKDEKSPIEIESTSKKELIPMPQSMPLNICQSQQSLSIPISMEEAGASQRRISSSSSHHNHRSGDRRLSSRKTSKMECERHRKTHSSVASTAPGIIGQLVRRLSSWIQIGLGLNSTESSTNLGVDKDPFGVLPGFLRNSRSFSSMSSISSSTQPGMFSKRTSVLLSHATHQHQIQIPTLTITRDSLPQGAHQPASEIEEKNAQFQNLQKVEDNSRRSSGFLQALFAPISTFQRRRKKTKAERRAHKAFRTITFIVGLFAILWSPYYVVATVYGFCRGDCIPSILYNVSYYMCYLNSSLNPFAYALANRQFRTAFSRILRGNFRQSN